MQLDPRRTFATVIAGSANQNAIALARCVSRGARDAPNPLLLWGHTGVGKTQLLAAAVTELVRRGTEKLVTITTEEFRNAYVRAIRTGTIPSFRHVLDDCDALIVDELEDTDGYPSTLEELHRAIRVLVARGKPVLLASTPTSTFTVEQIVRGFPGGAIAAIRSPTIDQRTRALERHARLRRARVSRRRLVAIARASRSIGDARAQLDAMLLSAQRERRARRLGFGAKTFASSRFTRPGRS